MQFTHRGAAQIVRSLALVLGGSIAAQLGAMVPAFRTLLHLSAVAIFFYATLIGLRYFGVLSGRLWAEDFDIGDTDTWLVGFMQIVFPLLVGVITTWIS